MREEGGQRDGEVPTSQRRQGSPACDTGDGGAGPREGKWDGRGQRLACEPSGWSPAREFLCLLPKTQTISLSSCWALQQIRDPSSPSYLCLALGSTLRTIGGSSVSKVRVAQPHSGPHTQSTDTGPPSNLHLRACCNVLVERGCHLVIRLSGDPQG